MTEHPPGGRLRRAATGIVVVALLATGACGGSALDPEDVVAANRAVAGQGGTVVAGPDGAVVPGTGPRTTGGGTASPGSGGTGVTGVVSGPGTGGSVVAPGTTGGRPAPAAGEKVASCAGFTNSTGITDDTIVIGNVSDKTGPVPGIFTPAVQAVQAYAAYFNSTSDICGRKLEVKSFDSQTNTSADAVATQKTCDETFAAVGSMQAFDMGGAATATKCRIPEMHALITNKVRADCPTCFAAESPSGGYFPDAVSDFFLKRDKPATQKAAMLYASVAASVDSATLHINAQKAQGWKFAYTSSFDIAEFNYGPYVQRLKSSGAKIVQFYGSSDMAVRMTQAFKAANYKPDYFVMTATSYDRAFRSAGSVVDGSLIYVDFTPVEESSSNPELRLYQQWLQQVAPGPEPTFFGMYAWSAARLFAEQAAALGGKLNRETLVDRFKKVRGWTSNGLHSPRDVGAKTVPQCWRFLQINGGTWRPYGPNRFTCSGKTRGR